MSQVPDQPHRELSPTGPDAVAAAFFAARQALAGRATRGARGQFVSKNGDAVGIGTRSAQLEPLIDAWVTDEEARILADMGGPDAGIAEPQERAVVLQLAKAQVSAAISWRSMWQSGGPVTSKGHKRRIKTIHDEDSDRVVRFSREVGYAKRAKSVALADVLAQHEDAQHGARRSARSWR